MGCGSSRDERRTSPGLPVYQIEPEDEKKRPPPPAGEGQSGFIRFGFKSLALATTPASNFLQQIQRKNRPKSTSEIDVIQWKSRNSIKEPEDQELGDVIAAGDHAEEEQDPEIISIRLNTYVQNLDDALKRSSECQTDPVNDFESAFDWDLSDRADIETQTNPPTRATSTKDSQQDHYEVDVLNVI